MAELVDSGVRREFESGAVRDISEGKGRCDLLPLDIVQMYVSLGIGLDDDILELIQNYIYTGDAFAICCALDQFAKSEEMDRITYILEISKQYEDGALKYAERNWEKGMPVHCYIDSAIRHYLKYLRGDTDEPHDRAFGWNLLGALWTAKHHPELNDLPFAETIASLSQGEITIS